MINQFFWQEILSEAKKRGLPENKKRAILREFLQIKFLASLYRLPDCQNLSFIGGTSLRLLRGLDRFSEDLDFDNFGLSLKRTKTLFSKAASQFKKENYSLEFDFKKTQEGGSARLRFEDLLFKLGLSQNPKEKLMVKIDFTNQERIETEVLLLSGFGESERVVTNTLTVLLSEKFKALLFRKQTRGRDFYDIYWLLSKRVEPNLKVLEKFKIKTKKEFFLKLKEVYQKKEENLAFYQRQIRPFLINEEHQKYLLFLKDLINQKN